MDGRGPEVLHQHQLPVGSAGARRDDQAADLLRAVVHHQPAGEQAIAHHVLEHVLPGDAVMTSERAISSAALLTSLREKKMALGLPVVPLEVCRRTGSS